MREKFKEAKIDCFKDDKFSHYGECYRNITDERLAEKLTHLFSAGLLRLEIELTGAGGKKKNKVVLEATKKALASRRQNVKTVLESLLEGNSQRKPPVPACPNCLKNDAVIPILYGFPDAEAFEKVEKGEAKLGGCIPKQPEWHCKKCKRDF